MENRVFNKLQGQQIKIIELKLICDDNCPSLFLEIAFNCETYSLVFINVSRFTIKDFSSPFEICGFEVLSNAINGWADESIYEIRDFEDDKIHFYCEKIIDVNDGSSR